MNTAHEYCHAARLRVPRILAPLNEIVTKKPINKSSKENSIRGVVEKDNGRWVTGRTTEGGARGTQTKHTNGQRPQAGATESGGAQISGAVSARVAETILSERFGKT